MAFKRPVSVPGAPPGLCPLEQEGFLQDRAPWGQAKLPHLLWRLPRQVQAVSSQGCPSCASLIACPSSPLLPRVPIASSRGVSSAHSELDRPLGCQSVTATLSLWCVRKQIVCLQVCVSVSVSCVDVHAQACLCLYAHVYMVCATRPSICDEGVSGPCSLTSVR